MSAKQMASGAMRLARDAFQDCRGGTALEYAIIASLISIVIIVGVASIGNETTNMFNAVDAGLNNGS